MPRLHPSVLFALRCIVAGLALAFVLSQLWPGLGNRLRQGLDLSPGPLPSEPLAAPMSYADAVARAAPSVVSIYVNKVVTELVMLNPTAQRFSGLPIGRARQRLQQAQGSGVIVSADGYLLTNHHVVEGADDIQVALWDGRVTRARVVGTDRATDLAVLRIDGSGLPAMSLEQDPALRVGDVVLAIGNPFGLSQTVTQGIVSALGRNQLNLTTYEDYIQTDAAINLGNSGGALVTARGELIGINTFIVGRGVQNAEGIGFAIPVATARAVLEQIVDHGVVVRGWLGAEYGDAPVLPGGLPADAGRGVALTLVHRDGPAEAVGLQPGDVLLQFNGEDIVDQTDLRDREAAMAPGSRVRLAGLRAGLPFEVEVELTQRPLD